jgi:protein translocase SecG subunit
MVSVLAVVQVLLVFVLIGLVLMHSGRDAGMGGMVHARLPGAARIVERNLTLYGHRGGAVLRGTSALLPAM